MSVYVRAAITTLLFVVAIMVGVTVAHFAIALFPKASLGLIILGGIAVVYFVNVRDERSKDRHAEIMKDIESREEKYRQKA